MEACALEITPVFRDGAFWRTVEMPIDQHCLTMTDHSMYYRIWFVMHVDKTTQHVSAFVPSDKFDDAHYIYLAKRWLMANLHPACRG